MPRNPKAEKEWCSYEIFIHVTLQNLKHTYLSYTHFIRVRYIRPIILFNYFLPRNPKPEKEWCSYEIFIHVSLQNLKHTYLS